MVTLGSADALEQVDELGWREFEALVQELLESHGYACRYVNGRRDHGADIIATKGDEALAIQVKHRADGRRWIGERAVQAVVTAIPIYECSRGVVITNSTFAPGVKTVARAHGVVLRDRTWLAKELASFCAVCATRVTPRVRRWCEDHSQQYHGNTYCFVHQRSGVGALRLAAR